MNAVIYYTANNKIHLYVADCVQYGNSFKGSDVSLHGVKLIDRAVFWTDDTVTPVYDPVTGSQTGWNPDTIDSLTEAVTTRPIIETTSHTAVLDSVVKLKDIISMTFTELDDYIDLNVTDLPSAKTYIKRLSKVVLAMGKVLEQKLRW